MIDYEQTLTITFKDKDEEISVYYTRPKGIKDDDLFWNWFVSVWPMLGIPFVKKGMESE